MRTRIPVALAAAALALTACSSNSTSSTEASTEPLQEGFSSYIAGEGDSIEAFLQMNPNEFSDITVDGVAANGISREVMTYTFAQQQDPASAASTLDSRMPALQSIWETQVFPLIDTYGVTGVVQGEYIYLNTDGETIWNQILMRDEAGTICVFDAVPIQESPTSCADVQ